MTQPAYTLAVHGAARQGQHRSAAHAPDVLGRAVDETTRGLAEDRFFKCNGAKKDPAWNDRNKPDEVREKCVELMNAAT